MKDVLKHLVKRINLLIVAVACVVTAVASVSVYNSTAGAFGEPEFSFALPPVKPPANPNPTSPIEPKIIPLPEFYVISPWNVYPMDAVLLTQRYVSINVSIIDVIVTRGVPEGINEEEVRKRDTWAEETGSYALNVFVTFKVTNPGTATVWPSIFVLAAPFMIDAGNRIRWSYVSTDAVYHSYSDISPHTGEPNSLRLLAGETREIVAGYVIDGKFFDEKDGWNLFIGLNDASGSQMLSEAAANGEPICYRGWVIDDDKITYLDTE